MSKHDWEIIEAGNWYTEYQCSKCKKKHLEHDDQPSSLPTDGCRAKQALPSSQSIKLKDHQIAQLVNELTEAAKKYGHAQYVREKLRAVVLKHLKPL